MVVATRQGIAVFVAGWRQQCHSGAIDLHAVSSSLESQSL